MPEIKISRRKFIQVSAASALLFSPLFRRMRADAATLPPILILYNTPYGMTINPSFFPTGSGSNFTLSSATSPLLPHKNDLLILKGIHMTASGPAGIGQHGAEAGCVLTNRAVIGSDGNFRSSGPSIDQILAYGKDTSGNDIGGSTKFRSVLLGIGIETYNPHDTISYDSAGNSIKSMIDPLAAFNLLFKDVMGSPPNEKDKKSAIYAAVKGDLNTIRNRVGADEKIKIDAHIEGILELERQLADSGQITCTVPPTPKVYDMYDLCRDAYYHEIFESQKKIAVAAIACGLTRIVVFRTGLNENGAVIPIVNANGTISPGPYGEDHTPLSHGDPNPNIPEDQKVPYPQFAEVNKYHSYQLASMIQMLKDAGVWPQVTAAWVTGMGNGARHRHDNVIAVTASGGSYFKKNQFIDFSATPRYLADLLVSTAQFMGSPITTFGNLPCNGAISAIKA